jgi:hypothetical protein
MSCGPFPVICRFFGNSCHTTWCAERRALSPAHPPRMPLHRRRPSSYGTCPGAHAFKRPSDPRHAHLEALQRNRSYDFYRVPTGPIPPAPRRRTRQISRVGPRYKRRLNRRDCRSLAKRRRNTIGTECWPIRRCPNMGPLRLWLHFCSNHRVIPASAAADLKPANFRFGSKQRSANGQHQTVAAFHVRGNISLFTPCRSVGGRTGQGHPAGVARRARRHDERRGF